MAILFYGVCPPLLNNILLITDSGSYVLLVLLDLTTFFDTVNHGILIDRLETMIGICGTAGLVLVLFLW